MGKLRIPVGAVRVRSESTLAGSYMLVFTLSDGSELKRNLGPDIFYAAKMAAVADRLIKQQGAGG